MPENNCPICGGEGWIVISDPSGRESVHPCECVIASLRENLLTDSGIPSRYQDCRLSNYSDVLVAFTSRQKKALDACHSFVEKYPDVKKGLLFAGKEGVGKTHLGVGVLQAVAKKGYSIQFLDVQDLFSELRRYYTERLSLKASRLLSRVLDIDLLLIDDLGVYDPDSNWVRDTLFHIINKRFNMIKHIIVTTNYLDRRKKQIITLEERIGPRLRSRLYELCSYYEIDGEDHRMLTALNGE
ncbi:ATP-binding protein [bacterium]|nr:ATP-binding protein [bacterium]